MSTYLTEGESNFKDIGDWYTKNIGEEKIFLVDRATGDGCTIFPSKFFDHQKFSVMHRGMSFNEVKLLVENKFHREKDFKWFKQFEIEAK